ncbi:hypothetical protein B0H16DRAFT_1735442 [Mycena metata]|uniref:Uncharacterized protein n=1 Tax=Mycena metata TaxID=1033252 RepID=A0AAD7MQ45_9AGAR|nr:hypothetical protein B0H16DRAFT_1735442 [Mycena metata]
MQFHTLALLAFAYFAATTAAGLTAAVAPTAAAALTAAEVSEPIGARCDPANWPYC